MKIHKILDWQYWYDRTCRVWYAARFDAEGFQIGDCIDAAAKEQIVQYIILENKNA
jgi:hypothetical protein